jgi:hypothetical protein
MKEAEADFGRRSKGQLQAESRLEASTDERWYAVSEK